VSLQNQVNDVVYAGAKASPAIAVSGASAAGMSLQTWVLIATLIYTVLQSALLVYNFIKNRKEEKES